MLYTIYHEYSNVSLDSSFYMDLGTESTKSKRNTHTLNRDEYFIYKSEGILSEVRHKSINLMENGIKL